MEPLRPFVFGRFATGENFTDRVEETARLLANFRAGVNTVIISPRRWGKTSLVRRAAERAAASGLLVVHLDIFACRAEEEFYQHFAAAVLRQTASRLEERIAYVKDFLSRLSPRISLSDGTMEMSLGLELRGRPHASEDVLSLPERIAQRKGCRVVVCIDEFQQIGEFSDSVAFQKRLRSAWQLQQSVAYCLFGSRRHMMHELFERQSLPFYKFGDTMHLGRIPMRDWVAYICSRFERTGKRIPPELAARIAEAVENHSSYVQQLAWLVWSLTDGEASQAGYEVAYRELVEKNSPMFEQQTASLSAHQMNFLRAMVDGHTDGFSRREVLDAYRLGSSANVSAVRRSLIAKELIEMEGDGLHIADPVLRAWLGERLRY